MQRKYTYDGRQARTLKEVISKPVYLSAESRSCSTGVAAVNCERLVSE